MTQENERRYIVEITDPTSGETTTVEATSRQDVEEALDLIWPTVDEPGPSMPDDLRIPPDHGTTG